MSERIEVGQIWQDYDKRTRHSKNPRLLRVTDVDGGFVQMERLDTGRKTRVHLSRMKPNSTGYLRRPDLDGMGAPQTEEQRRLSRYAEAVRLLREATGILADAATTNEEFWLEEMQGTICALGEAAEAFLASEPAPTAEGEREA